MKRPESPKRGATCIHYGTAKGGANVIPSCLLRDLFVSAVIHSG
jgi:hypothetical protein